MTILHPHADDLFRLTESGHSLISRATRGLRVAFKTAHRAIVAAKTRRLQRELMFHGGLREDEPEASTGDAAKFPRTPLILGDKWDF